MTTWSLFYGNGRTPVAQVVPDDHYPGMWRVKLRGTDLSDMVNFTRARDAAAAFAEQGPPERDARRFNWKREATLQPVNPTFAPSKKIDEGV